MSINFFGGYKAKKYEVTEDFKLGGRQVFNKNDLNNKITKTKIINIAFDDTGLDDGIEIFKLPKGDTILNVFARVIEAWNSGDSDKIDIAFGDIKICNGKDIKTATGLLVMESVLPLVVGENKTIEATVTSEGTAATKGKLEIIIVYTV